MTSSTPAALPPELQPELVAIDSVRPLNLNPRRGDVDRIRESVRRDGQYIPIIVRRETGEIVKGNHTWHAARLEGLKTIAVLWRSIPDDHEAQRFAMRDNRLSDLATNDVQDLADALRLLDDLDGSGYDAADMDRITAEALKLATDLAGPAAEPDTPDRPVDAITREGDLITLGPHSLLCGNATKHEDVDRLMLDDLADVVFMDPPFAIYGSSSGLSSSVSDDRMVRPFFEAALQAAQRATRHFAHVYVCTDWRSWPSIWDAAKTSALEPKNLLVWDKGSSGLGNNWANTYELIGYFAHMPPQKTMSGNRATRQRPVLRPNVLRANRPVGAERLHNAAKPVDLITEVLTLASDPGDLVLDLFGGSGSVLIAAGNIDRRCRMMELDPAMCDVIVKRWEQHTGQKAKRPRRRQPAQPKETR